MIKPEIKSIKVSNFYSFGNAATEFVFDSSLEERPRLFEIKGNCGTGKTSLVNAFKFISNCMHSDMPMRVYENGCVFARNKTCEPNTASHFEVKLCLNDSEYTYSINANFDKNIIEKESLTVYNENSNCNEIVFDRSYVYSGTETISLREYAFTLEDKYSDEKICLMSDISPRDKTFLHSAFDYIERSPSPCMLHDVWEHIYLVGNCLKNRLIVPFNIFEMQLNSELIVSDQFTRLLQAYGFHEIHGIKSDGIAAHTFIDHYGKWTTPLNEEPESLWKLIYILNLQYGHSAGTIVFDNFDDLFHPLLSKKLLDDFNEYYDGILIYTTRK